MALARSASGPGGLSINTGAANLFGSSSQTPAGGGLFGTASTQPAATSTMAAPSLFGGGGGTTTNTTQPSSLFGQTSTAPQTQATPAATGLFGGAAGGGGSGTAATTQAQPQTTGTGLFGGSAAATSKPAAFGGSLFGTPTTAASQPQATTGGLFGGAAATTATTSAPAPGSSLFGIRPSQPGSQQQQTQPQPQQQQQQQQQQPQQQQQQQVIPGVRIDLSNLKGTTRFNDLQEGLQNDIIAFDTLIQGYMEQKNEVDAFMPAHGEGLDCVPNDVRYVGRKYDGVAAALASDLQAVQALRVTVKQDAEHAQLSFKALDNQKLPAEYHRSGLWSTGGGGGGVGGGTASKSNGGIGTRSRAGRFGGRGIGPDDAMEKSDNDDDRVGGDAGGGGRSSDLINYFSHTGDDIGAQLKKLEANLGEIEVHMHSVQAGLREQLQRVAASPSPSSSSRLSLSGGGGSGDGGGAAAGLAEDKVAELAAVLRDFEESILSVASVVGSARESMTGLQLGGFLGRGP